MVGFQECSQLGLRIPPQPLGLLLVSGTAGGIDNDTALVLGLLEGRTEEVPPPLAGFLEPQMDLAKDLVQPLFAVGVSLELNFTWWSRLRATPLWLEIRGWDTRKPATYREVLSDLEHEVPPRLIVNGNRMLVPLRLPLGVSRERVIGSILDQVRLVADRIGEQEQNVVADVPKAADE